MTSARARAVASSDGAGSATPARGTALVTGAAKRIGATIAIALADDGWDVAVHYGRSRRGATKVVDAIRARGRRAVALDADLADEAATRALVDRTAEALATPLCVVNSASIFEDDGANGTTYRTLAAHVTINAGAPTVLAQAMHARLKARQRGVVVNLLDQKLFNLNPDYLAYTLSKAALHTATTMLARSLAPKLRVVGIAPGITLRSGDQTRADFEDAASQTPLGRSSTPDDIARAVCFVVGAPAITGTTLIVDGGQHLVPTTRDVMFLTRARKDR